MPTSNKTNPIYKAQNSRTERDNSFANKQFVYKNKISSKDIRSTHADLPSASNLVGQRPFLTMSAETLLGSFCSTACRSLSSLLLHS